MSMKTDHSKVEVDSLSLIILLDSSKSVTKEIIDSVSKFVEDFLSENENLLYFYILHSDSQLSIIFQYVNDEDTDDGALEDDYQSRIVEKFEYLSPSKLTNTLR